MQIEMLVILKANFDLTNVHKSLTMLNNFFHFKLFQGCGESYGRNRISADRVEKAAPCDRMWHSLSVEMQTQLCFNVTHQHFDLYSFHKRFE